MIVVSWIIILKDTQALISGTSEHYLYGQSDFADVIKLRILGKVIQDY